MENASSACRARRASALALAVVMAASLAFPQAALAKVAVDDRELAHGDNAVGGGKATLTDTALDMEGVTAGNVRIDENLTVNFSGGNDVEDLYIEGSAEVEVNFSGENEVEDTHVLDNANATINADGHNDFEEVEAYDSASVTVNVTGENDFETIEAHDDASVTVRGTGCQKRDIVNVCDDERDSGISAERGNVRIDHVTVNLESETARVGSTEGDLVIDTSKIASEGGNEYTEVVAGGKMAILESVIDVTGTVHADGQMTIEHSDVKAAEPDSKYDVSPYRVYSKTGIELIREENGELLEGEIGGEKVWFVDTDGNGGREVDLEADGEPGYYACEGEAQTLTRAMTPMTGDGADPWGLSTLALMSATTACFAARRRGDES